MSSCKKDLNQYDLIKKCSKCENVKLKSNFHKKLKSGDGSFSQCIYCVKTI